VLSPVVHPEPILPEVDDKLHQAVREAAFLLVRRVVALVIPEHLHELRERWTGDASPKNHSTYG